MKRAGHDEIHENIAGTESGGKKRKSLHQGRRHGYDRQDRGLTLR